MGPVKDHGLLFIAKCAAVLPAVWLVLFLLALPFPGGHPSLTALVAVIPAALSLTGRIAGWLMGDAGTFSVPLAALIAGTVIELALLGAVGGVAIRRVSRGHFPGESVWLVGFLIYVACHLFGSTLATSRAVTTAALSAGSPSMRNAALQRIVRSGDRSYREALLSALEKGSEPDVDEDIIAALTRLEDGAFWHGYLTSPRGSLWGMSVWAKVLCDLSTKSHELRQSPVVDFARLTESFANLNTMMFERMVAALPDRPELLNPLFSIALNNPRLGRARVDQLSQLLQRPSIAKCVHLPMSFRDEWSDPSHHKHRLYELATATCQEITRADLELWLTHAESAEEAGAAPLNATGLCLYIVSTEGIDRKGR